MGTDEEAIRATQTAWFEASASGDLPRLMALMTEDVVFLTPGRPPFGRDVFAANFQAGRQKVRIECGGEMEELIVVNDVAYARSRLSVSLIPLVGGEPKRFAGYTLTIFRRTPDGRWRLARDANLLAEVVAAK